ncbi:MAG: hypothetical protein JWM56_834 [Candidatus Peribacteria bacterium]|nr:hypothetical protein [Candidatus Peribacteria bacterium]
MKHSDANVSNEEQDIPPSMSIRRMESSISSEEWSQFTDYMELGTPIDSNLLDKFRTIAKADEYIQKQWGFTRLQIARLLGNPQNQ